MLAALTVIAEYDLMGDDVIIVGASPVVEESVIDCIQWPITFLYATLSIWPSVARARSMLHKSSIPESCAKWE